MGTEKPKLIKSASYCDGFHMEIVKQDLKKGTISLKINNMDDLWHLVHVLEVGDKVTSKTVRKTTVKRGDSVESGERKAMVLTVDVEKVSLESTLRITGKIVEGPEGVEHNYHTLDIEPGSMLTIEKEWKSYQIDRLKKAKVKAPLLFICVLDRDEANFASLKESGIQMLGTINASVKDEGDDRTDYYQEVMEYLLGKEDYQNIVVAGPGFEKENLLDYIKRNKSDLSKKIILEQASSTGKPGVQEVIKRSANNILKDSRVSREANFVEEFIKRISQNGLVVYGIKEAEEAVEIGAVETLLVSIEKVRELEKLLEKTEKLRGKVVLISSDHDLGEQFLKLGGIGGFLRYRIK